MTVVSASKSFATAAHLVHVSDATPGIRRLRRGCRFRYVRPDGRALHDKPTLQRIARLAIPPAYEDVWICTDPSGHLQATGRDARGRKQYRYRPVWRNIRDFEKFRRMPDFADALPRLRRRLRGDLARPGLPREKVLAVVVSLLDATRLRVGNREYARANGSYGLATLRSRHVRFVPDGTLVLRFRGKGGVPHAVSVDDKRLARLVRRCHELPGQPLFQYVDEAGELRHRVIAGSVAGAPRRTERLAAAFLRRATRPARGDAPSRASDGVGNGKTVQVRSECIA